MKNKKVLVVLGGTSGEREVSLDTGKACIKAIKKLGYKVSTFDIIKNSILKNVIDISRYSYHYFIKRSNKIKIV